MNRLLQMELLLEQQTRHWQTLAFINVVVVVIIIIIIIS